MVRSARNKEWQLLNNVLVWMLAVNPRFTPPQVIQIIVATADKTAESRRTLINPAKALGAAWPGKAR